MLGLKLNHVSKGGPSNMVMKSRVSYLRLRSPSELETLPLISIARGGNGPPHWGASAGLHLLVCGETNSEFCLPENWWCNWKLMLGVQWLMLWNISNNVPNKRSFYVEPQLNHTRNDATYGIWYPGGSLDNPLWHSDAIWRHTSGPTLAKVTWTHVDSLSVGRFEWHSS